MDALRFSGPRSGASIGFATRHSRSVGVGVVVGVRVTRDRGHLKVLHIDQRLLAGVSAWAGALAGSVVGGKVEGNKQNKVRGNDTNSGQRSKFFACTFAVVRDPREVGRGEIGIRGEIDEAYRYLVSKSSVKPW